MYIKRDISRRGFLFQGALAAGALATRRVWAAPPPSRTVTMAIIGAGGRGRQMLPVFLNQPGVRFLAVCDAVRIPVVASGGAGKPEHFVEAITEANASAVLAASVFHYGLYSIAEVKQAMKNAGIPVGKLFHLEPDGSLREVEA